MGGVVAGVPIVEGHGFGQRLASIFGMDVAALPLLFCEGTQQDDPALVERVNEVQRQGDRSGTGVGEIRPERFVIGRDGGPVFGEGEAHADTGIHVAVGDVVHELANGPATFAVGRVELSVAEAGNGGAEIVRERGKGGDGGRVIGEISLGAEKFADGITRISTGRPGGG